MLRVICLNQILKKAHAKVIAAHRKDIIESICLEKLQATLSCQTMYVHSAESEASNVSVMMMNQQLF
jgi:hypothetical protein